MLRIDENRRQKSSWHHLSSQRSRQSLLGILPRAPHPLWAVDSPIVALSVSISASKSPSLSFSPTFFSHLCTVPIVMVGDRAGRVIWEAREQHNQILVIQKAQEHSLNS